MEEVFNWLILRNVKGVGNKSLKKLYDFFNSSEEILSADINTLSMIVGREKAARIKRKEGVSLGSIERLIKLTERWNIKIICIEDKDYPSQLKIIEDPPPVIFSMGDIREGIYVGIVGSRFATSYSLELTDQLCKALVEIGAYTVSGGAKGIDTKVHESTIKYGGYTLWIAGTGLLNLDISLKEKILKAGSCIISEFDPFEKGSKYTFSQRNRLISGMAEIVVITEAGKKSGSLITAGYALKQNKRVFVHIGMGRSERWEGCYRLLKEGKAEIFKDPSDITEVIKPVDMKTELAEEAILTDKESTATEEQILALLEVPKTFDQLLIETGMKREELMGILSMLEIEGKVVKSGVYYMIYNI